MRRNCKILKKKFSATNERKNIGTSEIPALAKAQSTPPLHSRRVHQHRPSTAGNWELLVCARHPYPAKAEKGHYWSGRGLNQLHHESDTEQAGFTIDPEVDRVPLHQGKCVPVLSNPWSEAEVSSTNPRMPQK